MRQLLTSMEQIEQITRAASFIEQRTAMKPDDGIILGTGLGNLAGKIQSALSIEYKDIPGFPLSTVESHTGRLLSGRIGGSNVVAMQGRFHYYEGYSMQQIVFPVRVMKMLGIRRLFISNAAGGLDPGMEEGDLMIIRDHINLQPSNPLIGPNPEKLGPRFPDMLDVYDKKLIALGLETARRLGIRCSAGVYASVPGPNLETVSEYKYLRTIGADAVGMSTVPEVIAAAHMSLPVFAVSVITDVGFPPERVRKVTLEKVIAVAAEAEPKMTEVMMGVLVDN